MPFRILLLLLFICLPTIAQGANYYPLYPPSSSRELGNLDFSIIKRGADEGLKVFIAGGIQGDEPGGFSAASLLSTHYRFTNAQIYIIPNLNFDSIIKRARGASGDMNRKFAALSEKDPQYDEVKRLQEYIDEIQPDMLVNLHDGSGFYFPEYVSALRNPNRWGQSLIIDQAKIDSPYGNLEEIGQKVILEANKKIENDAYHFHVNNTHTDTGHPEMEKTLTWYAIQHEIPAFGLEVSKEFNKVERVYYHLIQIEAFFETLGIEYEREFPLSTKGVAQALDCNVYLTMAQGRVVFPLNDLKKELRGYIPLPLDAEFTSPQPIVGTVKRKNSFSVHYGNSTITNVAMRNYKLSEELPQVEIVVDGQKRLVEMGCIVEVQEEFLVSHTKGLRVNAIGAREEILLDSIMTEANVEIRKDDFDSQFAIDKAENLYRIEIYQGKDFVGMFLVDFSPKAFKYEILTKSY